MGHDELCAVNHYADKHYIKHAPLPTPFPTTAAKELDCARLSRLSTMKAALLHRSHETTIRNENTPCNPHASNRTPTAGLHTCRTTAPTTAPYTPVECATDAADRPATHQHLVDEFLLDGSAQLGGRTLSGYPVYGHRSAEERLAALQEALYKDGAWCAVEQLPSRPSQPTVEHGHPPHSVAEEEEKEEEVGRRQETREQYWRRLARHYVARHADSVEAAADHEAEDPFYIVDLGRVVEQIALWRHCLPMVRPHYAVKCNPNPAIIEVLAACGAGFDCASKAEIDLVLRGGKRGAGSLVGSPDDIIFANPSKQPGDLKAAAAAGVSYVTFDSASELEKIARYMPNAKAVLRIRTNDAKAVCQFSVKFGAAMEDVEGLLDAARRLHVDVYGVSFHVGSGNGDAEAYTSALRDAHRVFQLAARKGFNCTLLDLGGGYPGVTPTAEERARGTLSFEEIAAAMRPVLAELFSSEDTRIIAEPGRFFTAATHALVMNVFAARRVRMSPSDRASCTRAFTEMAKARTESRRARAAQQKQQKQQERLLDVGSDAESERDEAVSLWDADSTDEYQYYVNDGLYGSFNCILFDHAAPQLLLLDDGDGAEAPRRAEAERDTGGCTEDRTAPAAFATVASACEADLCTPASEHLDVQLTASVEGGVNAEQQAALERRRYEAPRPLRVTTIYGPTCDSMDCILRRKPFPEMQIGDWLLVPDMGSYTTAAGCAFNGFANHRREWVSSVRI